MTEPTMVRLFGAAILGIGFASIIAWKRVDWGKIRIIIEMNMLWTTFGILAMLFGAIYPLFPNTNASPLPPMVVLYIVIFIAFDLAFFYIYYLFRT